MFTLEFINKPTLIYHPCHVILHLLIYIYSAFTHCMTKLLSLLLVLAIAIFLEQLCSCSEFSDSGSLTPETSSKKNKVNFFRKRSDRSEASLLMGKIKIDGFVEKFELGRVREDAD